MRYIILDLEWDSAYSVKHKRFINQILQIGAVKLDESFDITDTFEVTVKSAISKKVTGRFAELTGITTEKMLAGVPIDTAVDRFNEWTDENAVTMTWSDSDLYSIKENEEVLLSGGRTFKIGKYLDLQKFIQGELRLTGYTDKNQISLAAAAEKLGVEIPKVSKMEETLPGRPPVMCAGCPHRGLFFTLAKNKCTVLGDIGCYTLGAVAPLSAMEMTLCMGASISSIHGFNKALGEESEGKTVAVIGDSTFMHSGMTGLANIAYNQSNSTVIILDNSITGMTGHQQNPTTGYNIKGDPAGKIDLEALCRAMGFNRVRVVDPYDLTECDTVLKEELAAKEPSVIISRRPCALLKYVKHNKPLKVACDKCVGCKACMRLGCPAISMKDGKAVIDETLCVGCGVCEQMCKFGALKGQEV